MPQEKCCLRHRHFFYLFIVYSYLVIFFSFELFKVLTVWPDLAKFLHFGKKLKVFGEILRIYLVLAKILNQPILAIMLLGKFSLLIRPNIVKII